MTVFDEAFERIIGHEGGFQNDPQDRGNWTSGQINQGKLKGTKYGISAMSYPDIDIESLSMEQAKHIYRRDFWDRAQCDEYDFSIGFQFFDAAVNHGPGNAIRFLQRAVQVADDGIVGPITIAAIHSKPVSWILLRFLSERLRFMTRLSTWSHFGKGWAARVAENMRLAAEDSRG